MLIQLEHGTYNIYWIYTSAAMFNKKAGKDIKKPIATSCIIAHMAKSNHDTYSTTSVGIAACNDKDKFYKEVGRKISLERALHSGKRQNGCTLFTPKEREYIWNQYHLKNMEKHFNFLRIILGIQKVTYDFEGN